MDLVVRKPQQTREQKLMEMEAVRQHRKNVNLNSCVHSDVHLNPLHWCLSEDSKLSLLLHFHHPTAHLEFGPSEPAACYYRVERNSSVKVV